MRCPFCHNASLALPERERDVIGHDELMAFLKKRVLATFGIQKSGSKVESRLDSLIDGCGMRRDRVMGTDYFYKNPRAVLVGKFRVEEAPALRKSSEAIRRGDLRFILPDDPVIFAFERTLGSESYFLIADFSSDPVPFPVDLSGYGDVAVSNTGRVAIDKDMVLEPYETIVIRKR